MSTGSGFFALDLLRALEKQKVDAYVPDSNLARMLNRGGRLRWRARDPVHRRMQHKSRSPLGGAFCRRRKALTEPISGC